MNFKAKYSVAFVVETSHNILVILSFRDVTSVKTLTNFIKSIYHTLLVRFHYLCCIRLFSGVYKQLDLVQSKMHIILHNLRREASYLIGDTLRIK